jgi:hypothetical protein
MIQLFIDIHAHAYRKPPPFLCRACTAEELIERYDAVGIERGALLPIVSPGIWKLSQNPVDDEQDAHDMQAGAVDLDVSLP